uniref:tRNA (34-2'-O)-methyltransferase regulator WDR6 n=1 Tax=Petromyzon marinus TaxID=7757 RepID=A0AAJ7TQR5_PETMA|nr:WD repeat-containing protein 6 [Petromyzon marinus]
MEQEAGGFPSLPRGPDSPCTPGPGVASGQVPPRLFAAASTLLRAPITALEFAGRYLLIGEGPWLLVCDPRRPGPLLRLLLLGSHRVHGLRVRVARPGEAGDLVAAFGGKEFAVARLWAGTDERWEGSSDEGAGFTDNGTGPDDQWEAPSDEGVELVDKGAGSDEQWEGPIEQGAGSVDKEAGPGTKWAGANQRVGFVEQEAGSSDSGAGLRNKEAGRERAACSHWSERENGAGQTAECWPRAPFIEKLSEPRVERDWIWDSRFVQDSGCSNEDLLAVALAHNAVRLWEWRRGVVRCEARCADTQVLYSARLVGSTWDSLCCLAGTVGNHVVLWKPAQAGPDGHAPVLRRLAGHSGVIFSIDYDERSGVLASASDDRSVRVWRLGGSTVDPPDPTFDAAHPPEQTDNSTTRSVRVGAAPGDDDGDGCSERSDEGTGHRGGTSPGSGASGGAGQRLPPDMPAERVLFGHQARVFVVRVLPGTGGRVAASAGEDGAVLMWDLADGRVLGSARGHPGGRGVRALAVHADTGVVATGGADSAVRLWQLNLKGSATGGDESKMATEELGLHAAGTPKILALPTLRDLIVMTDAGEVLWRDLEGGTTRTMLSHPEFHSYSLMAVTQGTAAEETMIALGNLDGKVRVFPLVRPGTSWESQPYEGKVHNLTWADAQTDGGGAVAVAFATGQRPRSLFSSGPDGLLIWWEVAIPAGDGSANAPGLTVREKARFRLPMCRQRWHTCASFVPGSARASVVCGDRRGSLLLFVSSRNVGKSVGGTAGEGCSRDDDGDEGDNTGAAPPPSAAEPGSARPARASEECNTDGGIGRSDGSDGCSSEEDKSAGSDDGIPGPASSLFGLHGRHGVTSLVVRARMDGGDEGGGDTTVVYSTGRDGVYRTTAVAARPGRGLRLVALSAHRPAQRADWLERLLLIDDAAPSTADVNVDSDAREPRVVVLGFRSRNFVAICERTGRLLASVPCGGGHRSWAYQQDSRGPQLGPRALAYIKAGRVCLCRSGRRSRDHFQPVLREGLHGREVTCVRYLGDGLIVTASEDTTVRVSRLPVPHDLRDPRDPRDPCDPDLVTLLTLREHVSSVKVLAIADCAALLGTSSDGRSVTMPPVAAAAGVTGGPRTPLLAQPKPDAAVQRCRGFSRLLFSAGGRAELRCCRITVAPGGTACHVESLAAHRLDAQWERRRDRHRFVKADPETRYMCVCVVGPSVGTRGVHLVAAACSDAYVRLFAFEERARSLELLAESDTLQRCVLCVDSVDLGSNLGGRRCVLLASGATDGTVAFWDVGRFVGGQPSASAEPGGTSQPADLGTPCGAFRVHQSGVSCVRVQLVDNDHGDGRHHHRLLVVSGGDDGAISMVTISVDTPGGRAPPVLCSLASVSVDHAHAAQVTAVAVLPISVPTPPRQDAIAEATVAAVSADQRLSLWRLVAVATGAGTAEPLVSCLSHVADLAAFDWRRGRREGELEFVVAGVGVEVIDVRPTHPPLEGAWLDRHEAALSQ